MNFHRYHDAIFTVVKEVVCRAFLWLYTGGTQYVGDYLQGMQGVRLGSMEKQALRRKDPPVKFDIPFLYKLLQHACGLSDHNSYIWNNPTTPLEERSVEHVLFLLKEKRNELCHKPQELINMTREELENHLDELSRLCELVLREAGQKANRQPQNVNDSVKQMRDNLDTIQNKQAPSGINASKFGVVARNEMKTKNTNPLPLVDEFVLPLIESKGKDGCYRRHLKQFLLWRCNDGSFPQATVLTGETGTGKTSIWR